MFDCRHHLSTLRSFIRFQCAAYPEREYSRHNQLNADWPCYHHNQLFLQKRSQSQRVRLIQKNSDDKSRVEDRKDKYALDRQERNGNQFSDDKYVEERKISHIKWIRCCNREDQAYFKHEHKDDTSCFHLSQSIGNQCTHNHSKGKKS